MIYDQMNNKSLSEIGKEVGELCQEKNDAYGDSFARSGKILEELYPDGVRPDQYMDMLGIVRVIDKLFRIATRKDAFGESPWKDIAGYGVLGVYNDQAPAMSVLHLLGQYSGMTEEEVNEELCRIHHERQEEEMNAQISVTETISSQPEYVQEPRCENCFHQALEPSEMPCKKCLDKPFLPHFTASVPVKSKGFPGEDK